MRFGKILLTVILAAVLGASVAVAGEFEKSFEISCDELVLYNLVGAVTVEAASGDDFEVRIRVLGDDADEDVLDFVLDEGRDAKLVIEFPLKEHQTYIYPPMGRNSNSTINAANWRGEDSSWLDKIGLRKGSRIKVKGKGRGLEVWADVIVKVPRGKSAKTYVGVGQIDAEAVRGDLVLDTSSGAIGAVGIKGELLIDTGSGSVEVNDCEGDQIVVDTGSGSVRAADLTCRSLLVDTGSGRVGVRNVHCSKLVVDTGSGAVVARGIKTDSARLDTGSGGVELQLDDMGDGKFIIDTGSGSIELYLPEDASAEIEADTGSGRVRADIDGADIRTKSRDHLRLTVGDGDAMVRLDAGSGSITITQ